MIGWICFAIAVDREEAIEEAVDRCVELSSEVCGLESRIKQLEHSLKESEKAVNEFQCDAADLAEAIYNLKVTFGITTLTHRALFEKRIYELVDEYRDES